MYEDCKWGYASEDELAELLKKLYKDRKQITTKGKQALKDIQRWTWKNSAQSALKALRKLK